MYGKPPESIKETKNTVLFKCGVKNNCCLKCGVIEDFFNFLS